MKTRSGYERQGSKHRNQKNDQRDRSSFMSGDAQVEMLLKRSTNGIIEMDIRGSNMGSGDWKEGSEDRRIDGRTSSNARRESGCHEGTSKEDSINKRNTFLSMTSSPSEVFSSSLC
jgi:hypothetical protein